MILVFNDDYSHWIEPSHENHEERNALSKALKEATEALPKPLCVCGKFPLLLFMGAGDDQPWKLSCECGRFTRAAHLKGVFDDYRSGKWLAWKSWLIADASEQRNDPRV